jgi:glycosyltransferase involved in cell wall biosynthesis
LITVVCAVHNGERFVAEAVRSAVAQTGVDVEVVVVDDGSTDTTPAILAQQSEDPRVVVVTQENRGVAAARNEAMRRARGEFIAFIDADDIWLPDKLQRQLKLFLDDPGLALAFTGYALTDESLRARSVVMTGGLRSWLLLEGNGQLLSSSGMVRRSALGEDLRFDEALSISADVEFAWRAAQRGRVSKVRAPLVLYRLHDAQMHDNMDALERDMNRIYGLVFDGRDGRSDRDRRRGTANLYTRLVVHELRAGRPRAAWRHLGRVARFGPSRLVMLPLGAARRRVVRYAFRYLAAVRR